MSMITVVQFLSAGYHPVTGSFPLPRPQCAKEELKVSALAGSLCDLLSTFVSCLHVLSFYRFSTFYLLATPYLCDLVKDLVPPPL